MAITGYRIRKDGGTPVDVGLTNNYQWLDVAEGASVLFELQSYDAEGQSSDWVSLNKTIPLADDPLLVGHGDSMMWGSGNEATNPATDNPSIQTVPLLTGTWQHSNVGYPGASFGHAGGSPDDLIAGGVTVVDALYDATALYNVLIINGGINNVPFVPGPIALATNYPWLLRRLKTFYIEYGLARRAVGWGNGLGPIVSPMPVCDFPNTPSDYETYLRTPFNAWLASNFYLFAAEYADWTGNANIGDGANTNDPVYFDVLDPDSGGTADRLHLTAAGYAIEATYFADAIDRTTSMVLPLSPPANLTLTTLNCEQISVGYMELEGIEAVHHYELRVNGGALTDEIIDIGRSNPYVIKNLAGGTVYAAEVRAVDVGGFHSSWTAPELAITTTGDFEQLFAIDCGRTSGGTVAGWLQDTLFTNGTAHAFSALTARTFLVTDPAPNAVYQNVRISTSIDPLTYTFTDLDTTKHHRVRLHFIDGSITHNAAPAYQQWYMDVEVNNVLIKDNLDLSMEVGVGEVVYIIESEVAAGPSSITVEITQVSPGTAQIAAVELYGVLYTPPPPPPSSKIDIGRTTGGVVALWDDEVTTGTSVSGGTTFNQAADAVDTTGETNPAPEDVYRNCRYELGAGAITAVISGLTPSANYNFRTHHWSSGGNITNTLTMKCTANGVEKWNQAMVFVGADGVWIKDFAVAADGSGEVTLVFEKVTTAAVVCGIEWVAV